MLLFRECPVNAKQVNFIRFVSSETIVKISDHMTLNHYFDQRNESRDALVGRQEIDLRKQMVLNQLEESSVSVGANAIINFEFHINKVDNKNLMLQCQGFAVYITFEENTTSYVHTRVPEFELPALPVVSPENDVVKKLSASPEIRKIAGEYLDIGGAHQLKLVNQMKGVEVDSRPLELPSEEQKSQIADFTNESLTLPNDRFKIVSSKDGVADVPAPKEIKSPPAINAPVELTAMSETNHLEKPQMNILKEINQALKKDNE